MGIIKWLNWKCLKCTCRWQQTCLSFWIVHLLQSIHTLSKTIENSWLVSKSPIIIWTQYWGFQNCHNFHWQKLLFVPPKKTKQQQLQQQTNKVNKHSSKKGQTFQSKQTMSKRKTENTTPWILWVQLSEGALCISNNLRGSAWLHSWLQLHPTRHDERLPGKGGISEKPSQWRDGFVITNRGIHVARSGLET